MAIENIFLLALFSALIFRVIALRVEESSYVKAQDESCQNMNHE